MKKFSQSFKTFWADEDGASAIEYGLLASLIDQQAKEDQDRLVEKFGGREKALKMGTPGASPVPCRTL